MPEIKLAREDCLHLLNEANTERPNARFVAAATAPHFAGAFALIVYALRVEKAALRWGWRVVAHG